MHRPFHEWLQQRITEVGLSGPSALATAMTEGGLATCRRTTWRWVRGHRLPMRESWPALAQALQVPLDQLALRVVGVEPMEVNDG